MYRALLAEGRREKLDDALERIGAMAETAVDALEKLLAGESDPVRLRAAELVLQLLVDAEARDMLGRLDRLEEIAGMNGR
jgi:hypothetical protein